MLKAVASPNAAAARGTGGASGSLPLALGQWGVPFIHVSSGSIGNNGALTAITALPRIYSNGCWMYFPANAIAAGVAAGWYWVVMSSTTAGTIYNSTYTPATSGAPRVGTTTAFVTTGPGAYVGVTAEQAGPTIAVPAGAMGASGELIYTGSWQCNNTVGAKTGTVKFSGAAGTAFTSLSLASLLAIEQFHGRIANAGLTNVQIGSSSAATSGGSFANTLLTSGAIDTTAATTLVWTLTKATATDNLILERGSAWLAYAA